ncbi:MAG TPA: hypothetical protein VJU18_09640 [Vicinamibacteria bacterium]|nr:hypothetical protein [Vicinamibacteria bacterium]
MTAISNRRGEVACVAAVGFMALLFLAQAALPGLFAGMGRGTFMVVGCLTKLVLEGLGALLAHRAAGGFDPGTHVRRAWRLLSLGLLGFFLAQLALSRYQIARGVQSPFPSLADVFFVAAYPLLIAALVSFVKAYQEAGFPMGSASERWTLMGLVLALCLGLGYPMLAPVAGTAAPPLEKLLNLAYPLLDLALLVPTAFLLRVTLRLQGGNVQRVWVALLVGVLALAGGDIAFAYFSTLDMARLEPVVDALFIASYGSFAWGSLAQRNLLSR